MLALCRQVPSYGSHLWTVSTGHSLSFYCPFTVLSLSFRGHSLSFRCPLTALHCPSLSFHCLALALRCPFAALHCPSLSVHCRKAILPGTVGLARRSGRRRTQVRASSHPRHSLCCCCCCCCCCCMSGNGTHAQGCERNQSVARLRGDGGLCWGVGRGWTTLWCLLTLLSPGFAARCRFVCEPRRGAA